MPHYRYGLLVLLWAMIPLLGAQEDESAEEDQEPKTIAELIEESEQVPGLFTLFQNRQNGKTHLLLKSDQLDKEYVYVAQVRDGVVQTGYFRGRYIANNVIVFERHFDTIELIARNTSHYFDPDNALARAADANIGDAVLATTRIVAEDEVSGELLIEADGLFATEALRQIKPTPDPEDKGEQVGLGELDKDKTRIVALRSYSQNTDVAVRYVYYQGQPKGAASDAMTDPRSISVEVLHTFIEAPESDYQPRFADPRVGFFTAQVTDLTSFSPTPYRDPIARWHLAKKDPNADVSDPVEPITWWIENTTPVEYRDLIRDAALAWNSAFEKAGFSNAVAVKVQPDDADWDAGDIRYNVLRWTSSPNPPFGGYGPSFAHPRTGQILGADVMLEFSFLNRYLYARQLLADGASIIDHFDQLDASGEFCTLGQGLKNSNLFARVAADAAGFNDDMSRQLIHDTMHYLILHEIGHTLGLNHNMKATQLLSPDEAFDAQVVAEKGLSGSVMDYPAVNFAPRGATQTRFYAVRPGPYDDWAIEFGYTPALEGAQAEALLARSTEPQLAFGNDADDMRSPGKAIDPRINIYDMSNDAVGYADQRIDLLRTTLGELIDNLPPEGESYQQTHDAFVVLMREWARSAAVVSRYVGGVYLDRGMAGQPGAQPPYTPVEAEQQKRAIDVLARQVFSEDAMDLPAGLYRYLAQQRRGFNFFSAPEDPKVHDAWLAVQKSVLDHLLHPNVMRRITDSALYGNDYSLADVTRDLTHAIFNPDERGNVNPLRQNVQTEFVGRLATILNGKDHDYRSQAAALYSINQIIAQLDRKRGLDAANEAHVAHLRFLVDRALETRG